MEMGFFCCPRGTPTCFLLFSFPKYIFLIYLSFKVPEEQKKKVFFWNMRENGVNGGLRFMSFHNFVFFAIILIYFSNVFFSNSMSIFEANRRVDMGTVRETVGYIEKEMKKSQIIVKSLKSKLKELTKVVEEHREQIIDFDQPQNRTRKKTSTKLIERKEHPEDKQRREAVKEVSS